MQLILLYIDTVTNRIFNELERGTGPWVRPWKTTLPCNVVLQREYSGVNILLLWSAPHVQPAWLTFKEAWELGGYVEKGEKATAIVYASTYTKRSVDDSGEETEEEIPFLFQCTSDKLLTLVTVWILAGIGNLALQQNLWADSGSGSAPSV